jgi:rRNA maturation protein Nop10
LKDIQYKKYRVHGKQNENDLTNCKNTVFKNEYRYENKKRVGSMIETNFLKILALK